MGHAKTGNALPGHLDNTVSFFNRNNYGIVKCFVLQSQGENATVELNVRCGLKHTNKCVRAQQKI